MESRKYTLTRADDVHSFFRAYRSHASAGWWFRGQANAEWPLLPKAGRPEYSLSNGRSEGRLLAWSSQAVAYDSNLPTNEWERLAVAQHFGLATCLLDWSQNPLVSLYFACSELPDADEAVYCYDPDLFVDEQVLKLKSAECNGAGFIPRAISPRILNQRAVFTVHLPTTREIEVKQSVVLPDHPNLAMLFVPSTLKKDLLTLLNDYGINHVTLFPDLEGLSKPINWETQSMVKRSQSSGA